MIGIVPGNRIGAELVDLVVILKLGVIKESAGLPFECALAFRGQADFLAKLIAAADRLIVIDIER